MGQRIQYIAEVVFALMFIAVLALISTGVIQFGNSVNDQISRTNAVTEMRELRAFDETTVTGDTVISAIRNYDSIYDYELKMTVTNSNGTREYGAGAATSYDTSSGFINPSDAYKASLTYSGNGVVIGVAFVKA